MNTSEDQERIEQNTQRAAGTHALRKIRAVVDEVEREDAARTKLLRAFLSWGWLVLLLLAALLARRFGVI